jgi:uncharacterized protein (DUF302 family)
MLTSAALGFSLVLTAAAPTLLTADLALLATGAASFAFVTLCTTALQLHSSAAYRARVMAMWVYVFIGTTPLGSVITGWIITAAGPRTALLVGAGACGAAALLAARVRTPPNPDSYLSRSGQQESIPGPARSSPMMEGGDEVGRESLAVDETAAPEGDGVTTKVSPVSVPDTVARLCTVLAERGWMLFAPIDHSGEAKRVGLQLRDTKLVIFGSPRAGTPAMVAAPLVALDLPTRVLVWDDGSTTKISYVIPSSLAARYELTDDLASPLAGIDAITDEVIGQSCHPRPV